MNLIHVKECSCHDGWVCPACAEAMEGVVDYLVKLFYATRKTCPSDMYEWEHPETCALHCESESGRCETECWKTYAIQQSLYERSKDNEA